jgi:hypothetical protein
MKLGEWVVVLITMMVFLQFVGIPNGFSPILSYFGITIDTTTSELISSDLANSGFFGYIFGDGIGILLILLGGGALVIGLFAKSYDTSLVILPLVVVMAGLFVSTSWTTILFVKTFGQAWITALISTIFIAVGIAFVWSCVDYFAGR